MMQFEYKMLGYTPKMSPEEFLTKINDLGNDGWELVSVTPIDAALPQDAFQWFALYEDSSTGALLFTFKRQK